MGDNKDELLVNSYTRDDSTSSERDRVAVIKNGKIEVTDGIVINLDLPSQQISGDVKKNQEKLKKQRRSKYKELDLSKNVSINNKPQEFTQSAKEILDAVINDETIGGIRIAESIMKPNFRFSSQISSELTATDLSEFAAALLAKSRSIVVKKRIDKASQKRIEQAYKYAAKMYTVIEELKEKAGIKTLQETVDLLNVEKIQTAKGTEAEPGRWHIGTLQVLQKRWKELGLMPHTLKPR